MKKTSTEATADMADNTILPLEESCGYSQRFLNLLDKAIEQARDQEYSGALLTLCIDNLAMIMSGYGHEVTENVIEQVRTEINNVIGVNDHAMRIQRDQFGVILSQATEEEAREVCERICSSIHEYSCYSPYGSLHVITSISTTLFPSQAETAVDALDKSFIAMHENNDGTAIRAFAHSAHQSANDRQQMGLANYLSKAIAEERIRLAYQPIIRSDTGEVSHYEALLRLCNEDGKISSAGALIPVAERMGLIDVIDELTLDMVVKELRTDPDVVLAMNVSNLTTRNSKWLDRFVKVTNESPEISPRLIVEITETAAQRDLRRTAYFVAAIQAQGAQVALDDFGSGYTSFRQLKSLSVDMVKIDGAFIKDLVDNADNRFFVKTLLDFTNGFGLRAVAEY
ncbi:MAG: hypothetical protein CMM94_02740, partial [Rickettsiales bacterium]|nr:hypothetical protein [Rickettsiales bacterium]